MQYSSLVTMAPHSKRQYVHCTPRCGYTQVASSGSMGRHEGVYALVSCQTASTPSRLAAPRHRKESRHLQSNTCSSRIQALQQVLLGTFREVRICMISTIRLIPLFSYTPLCSPERPQRTGQFHTGRNLTQDRPGLRPTAPRWPPPDSRQYQFVSTNTPGQHHCIEGARRRLSRSDERAEPRSPGLAGRYGGPRSSPAAWSPGRLFSRHISPHVASRFCFHTELGIAWACRDCDCLDIEEHHRRAG